MNKRHLDNAANESAHAQRLRTLAKKYEYRTDAEELRPFYNLFGFLTVPIQFLSALFAAGGVLVLSSFFSSAFGVVMVATFGGLLVIELFKRLSYTKYNEQRNGEKGKISKTVILFCLLSSSASVLSSFLGAPHTVQYFAAPPALVDTAAINRNFEQRLNINSIYWTGLINDSKAKAEEIHARNSWKGRTTRKARPAVLAAVTRSENYKDSLNAGAAVIKAELKTALAEAKKENKEINATFKSWLLSFGFYSAVVSIILEICLFFIFFWRSNYETRELNEGGYLLKENGETHEREIKDEIKDETKDEAETPNFSGLAPSFALNKIGFHKDKDEIKDGLIIPPSGRQRSPRIYVEIDNELKLLRPSDIKNHIRNNNPGRAEELKQYLLKLENWKNENKSK